MIRKLLYFIRLLLAVDVYERIMEDEENEQDLY